MSNFAATNDLVAGPTNHVIDRADNLEHNGRDRNPDAGLL